MFMHHYRNGLIFLICPILMAQNKKSVLLYCDIIHTVEALTNEEAGVLFKHYLRYINDLNPEPVDKLTQIVFEPIKQNLKRDLRKWEAKSERNSEIAKAAWDKRKDANAYERIKTDAKNTDTVKDTVKDNDIKPIGAEHQKKQVEDMVVKEMMKTWKTHNPSYFEEDGLDYSACLEIAYKIAKMKKWRKEEVLNGKMQDALMSWGKIVVFVKYDPFLKKLSLSNLNSQWQNLVQKMSNTDNTDEKKKNQDNELMKKLGL